MKVRWGVLASIPLGLNSLFVYHTHTQQCISFLTKGPHFLPRNTRNTHHIYCVVSIPASTTILKQLRRQPGHWCKAKGITPSNTSNASAAVTAANQKLSGGQSPQIYSSSTWGWSTAWLQVLVTAHGWSNAKGSNPVVHWYKPRFTQLYPDLHSCFTGCGKTCCKW